MANIETNHAAKKSLLGAIENIKQFACNALARLHGQRVAGRKLPVPPENRPVAGLNILLFWIFDDWGKWGRTYERMAEHLAKLPEVNHVVCMFPPASARQLGLQGPLRIQTVSAKLTLITETDYNRLRLDASFSRIRGLINNTYDLYKTYTLREHLRRRGFRQENTLLWLFPPHRYIEHLLQVIPHRLLVSQVIDDFTKIDSSLPLYSTAKEQYPRLAAQADMVITTSEANRIQFSAIANACYKFLPAVDDSFLGQAGPLPHKSTGTAPRLGYVGWIMDRTDLALMEYVARQRPEWRLILAGPQCPNGYLDQSGLLDLPNVEYLGTVPQADVPGFLRTLDVCLMAHKDTEYSRSMGPLKLYQYLASGRPIVSTNVAGLEQVREHIFVAADHDEFIRHIETALQTDTPTQSANRINAAHQNTWTVRVREIMDTVLVHLRGHGNRDSDSSATCNHPEWEPQIIPRGK